MGNIKSYREFGSVVGTVYSSYANYPGHKIRVYFLYSDSIQILVLALKPKNSYLFHYDYEIQHVLIPKNLK